MIKRINQHLFESESTTTNYHESIVITLGEQYLMLQCSGDDEMFDDAEKKRPADEVKLIINQYRDGGISGGKNILRLWTSDYPNILPPTVAQVNDIPT